MLGDWSLNPDINLCPHYDSNKGNSTIENESCGFYGKSKIKTKPEYIREPWWYEKYYK